MPSLILFCRNFVVLFYITFSALTKLGKGIEDRKLQPSEYVNLFMPGGTCIISTVQSISRSQSINLSDACCLTWIGQIGLNIVT